MNKTPRRHSQQAQTKAAAFNPTYWVISVLSVLGLLIVFASQSHARGAPESFADLAEKLLPAVVNISTTQKN